MESELQNFNSTDFLKSDEYSEINDQLYNLLQKQDGVVREIQSYFERDNKSLILRQKIILSIGLVTFLLSILYAKFFIANPIERARTDLKDNRDNLEKRVLEQTKHLVEAQKEAEKITQIPLNNPNPLVRFTPDGDVSIANPGALKIAPDIWKSKFNNPLLEGLKDYAQSFKNDEALVPLKREKKVGSVFYSQTISPMMIDGEHFLILYIA